MLAKAGALRLERLGVGLKGVGDQGRSILWGAAVLLALALMPARGAGLSPHMELIPEEVNGVVLFPDGQTPVADLPIRVWDADQEKILFRTSTDRDGIFKLPEVPTGRLFIYVGRMRIEVRVLDRAINAAHQRHDLIIVISRQMVYGQVPVMEDVMLTAGAAGLTEFYLLQNLQPRNPQPPPTPPDPEPPPPTPVSP